MKAYVVTTGVVFALLTLAHFWRNIWESRSWCTIRFYGDQRDRGGFGDLGWSGALARAFSFSHMISLAGAKPARAGLRR